MGMGLSTREWEEIYLLKNIPADFCTVLMLRERGQKKPQFAQYKHTYVGLFGDFGRLYFKCV